MNALRAIIPIAFAATLARLARWVMRRTRHGGTTLPGRVLLALRPDAIARMSQGPRRPQHVVCVSATNGKTTLCAMLSRIAEAGGMAVVHNLAGANLRSGVATTMLDLRHGTDMLLLEVDEATLPRIIDEVSPDLLVLGNLFRDQLDRYGELESIARAWKDMLATMQARPRLVACVDDPTISQLIASDPTGHAVTTWGTDLPAEHPEGRPGQPEAHADAIACRTCGGLLDFERSFVGHLGIWRPSASCTQACASTRPDPDVTLTGAIGDTGDDGQDLALTLANGAIVQLHLSVRGIYNAYNALGACAAASLLNLDESALHEGLTGFRPAFGRQERIPLPDGGSLTLLLVKNPTGLTSTMRSIPAGADTLAMALNDGIADGRDVSWIWDAAIDERLASLARLIATGTRPEELALRAAYSGLDRDRIDVVDDIEEALDDMIATTDGDRYMLVTYTALLDLRARLSRRGWTTDFWRRQTV